MDLFSMRYFLYKDPFYTFAPPFVDGTSCSPLRPDFLSLDNAAFSPPQGFFLLGAEFQVNSRKRKEIFPFPLQVMVIPLPMDNSRDSTIISPRFGYSLNLFRCGGCFSLPIDGSVLLNANSCESSFPQFSPSVTWIWCRGTLFPPPRFPPLKQDVSTNLAPFRREFHSRTMFLDGDSSVPPFPSAGPCFPGVLLIPPPPYMTLSLTFFFCGPSI